MAPVPQQMRARPTTGTWLWAIRNALPDAYDARNGESVRFRLFDRVRRSREPERGIPGAVKERGRGSGRHRSRMADRGDRSRPTAPPPATADRRGTGLESRGPVAWRAQPSDWASRGGRDRRAPAGGGVGDQAGTRPAWDRPAADRDTDYRAGAPRGEGRPGAWAEHDLYGGGPYEAGPAGADRSAGAPDPDSREGDGDHLRRLEPPPAEARSESGYDGARPDASRRDFSPWGARPGGARARVRELPDGGEPFTSPVRDKAPPSRDDTRRGATGRGARDVAAPNVARDVTARRPWYEMANPGGIAASIRRPPPEKARSALHARPDGRSAAHDRYLAPHRPDEPYHGDGRRHCGSLERVLHREWDGRVPPPAEIVRAVDRLADLPAALKERLAAKLDGIFVGPGGVPDLDQMQHLRGVSLPAGRATWDVCAGAYGGRKIIVGTQPSPTPDVMCHEIGHAVDDTGTAGQWLSDQAEFRRLYDQCVPHLVSDFHRQPSGLGRREFFADAFAAIASRQRPALVDMLGGDTRTALNVMLYFNRRFGI